MRTLPPRSLAALLVVFLAGRAHADEVVLTHGSRLAGVVLSQDAAALRLLLPQGAEITLTPADVQEVVRDADAPQGEQVIRFANDGPGARGLQVAVVHLLHPTTGRRVDLIGAVHVADAAFYREVQRLLEADDVVLYEMVKPKDAPPGGKPSAEEKEGLGVRDLQRRMGEWFGLTFQMDGIAYDRPHFVHADLTLEEFRAAAGGPEVEAQLQGLLPALEAVEGMLKGASGNPRMQRTLKTMLGGMLGRMGTKIGALLGSDTSELLITRRNEVAVKRLTEVGAAARSVAIFYGAAHLPDLEKRLAALGYVRAAWGWLTAWDTRPPPPTDPASPASGPADAPKDPPPAR